MSSFLCEFTVSEWWMHLISVVIHLMLSAAAPVEEPCLLITNRGRHCPACQWVGEAYRATRAWCGVTLHCCQISVRLSVTKGKTQFCVFVRISVYLCVQLKNILKLRLHEAAECTATLHMKTGDRWRTVCVHVIPSWCTFVCVCVSLSWPCSCKRPRSIHKAYALFLGLPGKCDVTCRVSKMERGERWRKRRSRWGGQGGREIG